MVQLLTQCVSFTLQFFGESSRLLEVFSKTRWRTFGAFSTSSSRSSATCRRACKCGYGESCSERMCEVTSEYELTLCVPICFVQHAAHVCGVHSICGGFAAAKAHWSPFRSCALHLVTVVLSVLIPRFVHLVHACCVSQPFTLVFMTVHEKTILLPLLPTSFLFAHDALLAGWFSILSTFRYAYRVLCLRHHEYALTMGC